MPLSKKRCGTTTPVPRPTRGDGARLSSPSAWDAPLPRRAQDPESLCLPGAVSDSSRIRPANDRETSTNDGNGWIIEPAGQDPDWSIDTGSETGLENTLKVETRVRLDPLDPKTSQHAGECEFACETDPSVLRVLLKVKPGMGGNYSWVECGSCGTGWQVPHYAESVG